MNLKRTRGRIVLLGLLTVCLLLSICGTGGAEVVPTSTNAPEESAMSEMSISIGDQILPVTWEENASVDALRKLCPLTVQLSMYGGFEQVGPLGTSLPRSDAQTTTQAGDIVLYAGNQIVLFYGSNAWAYTRLGHIDLTQPELSELLGHGDVIITLKSDKTED